MVGDGQADAVVEAWGHFDLVVSFFALSENEAGRRPQS